MAKKLRRFQIILDDESLLYFPGAFLSGKVLLELEEDTPAIGLSHLKLFVTISLIFILVPIRTLFPYHRWRSSPGLE